MNKRIKGQVGWGLGGSSGSGNVMGEWFVGVLSFQKIFGLCGLKGHIVEIRWDVTLVVIIIITSSPFCFVQRMQAHCGNQLVKAAWTQYTIYITTRTI